VESSHVDLVGRNLIFQCPARVSGVEMSLIIEHRKETKLSAKHIIEEAMTAALVQKCNRCAKPFVKIHGCNKMTCLCGNRQCYVCGKSIKDYNHFERREGPNGTKCPLHEKDDSRLEQKLKDAQSDAVKKVLEEQDDLKEDDIKVDIAKTPGNQILPPPPMAPPGYAVAFGRAPGWIQPDGLEVFGHPLGGPYPIQQRPMAPILNVNVNVGVFSCLSIVR